MLMFALQWPGAKFSHQVQNSPFRQKSTKQTQCIVCRSVQKKHKKQLAWKKTKELKSEVEPLSKTAKISENELLH